MNKGLLSAIIIGVFIIIIGVFVFLLRDNKGLKNALDFVPEDAPVVLKFNKHVQEIPSDIYNSHIWNSIQEIPGSESFTQNIFLLDTLIKKNEKSTEQIATSDLYVSMHSIGRQKINSIFYLESNSRFSKNSFEELIHTFDKDIRINNRKYEGENIYDLKFKDQSLSMYLKTNLLMFSRNSLLIESIIRQEKNEVRYGDAGLSKLIKTEGKNVDANIYVHFEHFPEFISTYSSKKIKSDLLANKQYENWGVFDLQINEKGISINGFIDPGNKIKFLNLFQNQDQGRLTIDQIIPSNDQMFAGIVFSDLTRIHQQAQKLVKERKISSLIQSNDESFTNHILSLPENQAAVCRLEFNTSGKTDYLYSIIRIKSEKMAFEGLKSYAISKGIEAPSEQRLKIDEETEFSIIKCTDLNISGKLFGTLFKDVVDDYAVIIDNHIIFGESVKALRLFVIQLMRRQTLTTELSYSKLKDFIPEKTNFYLNINLIESLEYLSNFLNPEWIKDMKKHSHIFQKVQYAGLSLVQEDTLLYCNLHLNYLANYEDEPHTSWETLLDTVSKFKPVFVENHYTHQNEIFVQDLNNNIYLINKVGRVLWKLPLDGKINSEISQVDKYKNGKLQLLFSTNDKIYLIDRNGNNVEGFPVTLRSKASQGLSVFDYEKTRDYRIFIPTVDKNVYVYNVDGQVISGWKFEGSEHIATSKIYHYRIGSKDYIIFSDKYRLYILNRRGEIRVDVSEAFNFKNNTLIHMVKNDDNDAAKICFSENDGNATAVYFDGRVSRQLFNEIKDPDHYYVLEDLDGNGVYEHVFVDQSNLLIYKNPKVLLEKVSIPAKSQPVIYTFSSKDKKIGIVDDKTGYIYLYNNDGELYEGFPLKGISKYSIGRFNLSSARFNLLVNNKTNFLLNYSVK